MNTKLHAVTDADGRPTPLCMSESQVSGDMEAAALPSRLPSAHPRGQTGTGNR
jgi:hypothetical protein